ncbi:MAG: hypothetical protein AAB618_01215 [Patescibacteria group bacterium]
MNYKTKFFLFLIFFLAIFLLLRLKGAVIYQAAATDLGGIGWLFSTIGLIFSILSGFLIQHLWDKWERIQKIVLEEIHTLDHLIMFSTVTADIRDRSKKVAADYIDNVINNEWTEQAKLLTTNEAIDGLRSLNATFITISGSQQEKVAHAKLINSLLYTRERRILLATRRMPNIIKNTFLLSAVLVIGLSLLVAINNIFLDLIFTLSIGSLVCAIYLIVDDMDNILSPGAWHVSSKLYKEFLQKIQ